MRPKSFFNGTYIDLYLTYHKTEINDDLIQVDDDFWPSVNAVKVKKSHLLFHKCQIITYFFKKGNREIKD